MTTAINLKGRKPQQVYPDKGEIYCGRALYMSGWRLPKSIWSNPYKVGKDGSVEEVLVKYREYVQSSPELMRQLGQLSGKTLCCWCKPQPCHCDILLELVEALE